MAGGWAGKDFGVKNGGATAIEYRLEGQWQTA